MTNGTHWTERNTEDFLYSIASDFIEALKEKMKVLGWNQTKLASLAKVDKSYVSRTFKDPGNLTLETIVKFSRTVGMKVSILAYEDKADPTNTRGPVDPEVFRLCWENEGAPADLWEVKQKRRMAQTDSILVAQLLDWKWEQFVSERGNTSRRRDTGRSVNLPYQEIGPSTNTASDLNVQGQRLLWVEV